MKKLFVLTIVATVLLQSCATIISGSKKNIFMIDLPPDITVSQKGERLEVKQQLVGGGEEGNTRIRYMYPGVRIKMTKDIKLELESDGKKATVPVPYKVGGIPILILEGLFSFGICTIIDLVTGAAKIPKERFIDVPAVLNKTKPRSQKEMHKIVLGKVK